MEDKVEEILQETVVEALRSAGNYDPARPVRAWLLGIAIKRIQQLKRASYRQSRVIVSIHEAAQAKTAYQRSSISTITEADLCDFLQPHNVGGDKLTLTEMLSLVDQADREILSLHFIGGLTGEELAAAVGTSIGAAYVRLSRAKHRLRQHFRKDEMR